MNRIKVGYIALFLAACNPNDAGPGQPSAAFYAGPGSEWTAQVNPDSTSMLLHFPTTGSVTADELINADDAAGARGITNLTVTSSAGTSVPASGSTAIAVEVPGVLYTVAFPDTTSPIVMVQGQLCPGSALSANFVKLKMAAGSRASMTDVAGTFAYDPAGGIASEVSRYDVTGAAFGTLTALGAGPCATGIATLDSTDELYLSQNGSALLHTMPGLEPSDGDEIELALAQPDAAVPPSGFAGTYAGTWFDGATDRVVVTTIDATGAGAIATTDGTVVAQLALASSGAQNGLALGTLTVGSGLAEPAICAIETATPPIVACAGQTEANALQSLVLAGQ